MCFRNISAEYNPRVWYFTINILGWFEISASSASNSSRLISWILFPFVNLLISANFIGLRSADKCRLHSSRFFRIRSFCFALVLDQDSVHKYRKLYLIFSTLIRKVCTFSKYWLIFLAQSLCIVSRRILSILIKNFWMLTLRISFSWQRH